MEKSYRKYAPEANPRHPFLMLAKNQNARNFFENKIL